MGGTDPMMLDVLLDATRALLWIDTPADARRIAEETVIALGGVMVPASTAPTDAVPIDLSFGDGAPVLPTAPTDSVARMLLDRHLPSLVQDLRRAVELGSRTQRLAADASIDVLTGLPNRRMVGRALGRLRAGDVVIMIDLDHFKQVNDTLGHDTGDGVLRALGRALATTVRERDTVGRYGGEEFVVILTGGAHPDAFLERFRQTWEERRPLPVTFSAGIAVVGAAGMSSALEAADRAMYRAKEAGRDRWTWANDEDVSEVEPTATVPVAVRAQPEFVAFSKLEVPEGGQEQIETAFRARLGAVDGWEGFRSLEVWADLVEPTSYTMVSWWESPEAFKAYMRSDDHRRSHDRISTGEDRPRAMQFRRFRIVAR